MNLSQRDSERLKMRRRAHLPQTRPSDLLLPSLSSCNVHCLRLGLVDIYVLFRDDADIVFHFCRNDFRKTFKEENPGSNVKDVRVYLGSY